MDEIEQAETDFKRERARWREKIDLLKEKRRKATQAFREGHEDKELLCDEVIDWDKRIAKYSYEGKVIRERDLEPNEQQPMFDENNGETEQSSEKVKQVKLNKNGAPVKKQPSSSEIIETKQVMREEKSKFKKDHTA